MADERAHTRRSVWIACSAGPVALLWRPAPAPSTALPLPGAARIAGTRETHRRWHQRAVDGAGSRSADEAGSLRNTRPRKGISPSRAVAVPRGTGRIAPGTRRDRRCPSPTITTCEIFKADPRSCVTVPHGLCLTPIDTTHRVPCETEPDPPRGFDVGRRRARPRIRRRSPAEWHRVERHRARRFRAPGQRHAPCRRGRQARSPNAMPTGEPACLRAAGACRCRASGTLRRRLRPGCPRAGRIDPGPARPLPQPRRLRGASPGQDPRRRQAGRRHGQVPRRHLELQPHTARHLLRPRRRGAVGGVRPGRQKSA